MKNLLLISFVAVLALSACNNKLYRTDAKLKPIETPFEKKKYYSDKKHFRAMGEGRAKDLTVAKRIAETNARQSIASQVNVQVRSVGEQFLQNRNLSNKIETTSKYEEITRTVIDQNLARVKIVDQKSYQEKRGGDYVHYVAMEMDVESLVAGVIEGISADESLKQDFELEQFKKVYNEELERFGKGQ